MSSKYIQSTILNYRLSLKPDNHLIKLENFLFPQLSLSRNPEADRAAVLSNMRHFCLVYYRHLPETQGTIYDSLQDKTILKEPTSSFPILHIHIQEEKCLFKSGRETRKSHKQQYLLKVTEDLKHR